jgi:hypothetical protein
MGADQLAACLSGQKHKPNGGPSETDLINKPQSCRVISKKAEPFHDVDVRSTMASHRSKSIIECMKAHDFSSSNTTYHTKDCSTPCKAERNNKDGSNLTTACSAKSKKLSLSDF